MNYIVLEGISLYLVLTMIILTFAIAIGCLISVILSDKRIFILENRLLNEKERFNKLMKENFILKIRHGEFDINEK